MKPRSFSLVIPVGRPEREVDMSRQIAGLFYPSYLVESLFIRGENPPGQKRNQGACQARGEYLVFLDDDLSLPTDLLIKLNRCLEEDNAAVVGGANVGFKNGNPVQKMTDVAFSSPLGFGKGHVRFKNPGQKQPGSEDNLTACLLCIQKNIFLSAGGFDDTLYPGEEVELIRRLKEKNVPMSFNPDWFVYHLRRDTLLSLCRQVYRYGKSRVKIWTRQRFRLKDVSYLFPLALTLYFIFLIPGAIMLGKWVLTGFFFYFVILAAAGFGWGLAGNNLFRDAALLVVILASIHISYGLGMMIQLIKNKERNGKFICE
ncbi:MAG: glycosyltransferase [Acidobacteria bacterium]|jgi:GT2 family glycosyltransferase|nr:glycosyltransferase [Acidobacteriota bacterium]